MKLASIEPFSERYALDSELDLVAEEIAAEEGQTQGVNTELSSSLENPEEDEVHQGFVRLADFLAKRNKKEREKRNKSPTDPLRLKMIHAYRKVAEFVQTESLLGKTINQRY